MLTSPLQKGILSATIILVVIVGYIKIFGLHRPYVNWAPWDLATYLHEHDHPPSECYDLIWFEIMSPTQAEQQALCVFEYAKFTKDPSACELLMPSSYGLYCIGAAEESLPCDVTSVKYSVYWRDGDIEHTEGVKSCMQPNKNRSPLGNQCCLVAQVTWLKDKNDCSTLKNNIPVYDHCLYALAWKSKDPSYCEQMTSANPRAACFVQTKALQQDPSICTGCTPAVDSVDQLPK